MGKAARFVSSLRMRLKGQRSEVKGSNTLTGRPGINSWYSTSDLDRVDEHAECLLDDSGVDVTSPQSAPQQSLMASLMNRLRSTRNKTSQNSPTKRRSGVLSWFSTSDLDQIEDSSFLLEDTGLDVTSGTMTSSERKRYSGYVNRHSGNEEIRRSWILEDKVCLDLDRGEVTPCTTAEEVPLIKSDSMSSLLRATSIQDRSLKVTRKRRQNVAKRNRLSKYESFKKAIFPDEGIDVTSDGVMTDDSCDEILLPPTDKKSLPVEVTVLEDLEVITRQNSVQKKSWEIRRRRKQELQKKRRSANMNARPVTWIE